MNRKTIALTLLLAVGPASSADAADVPGAVVYRGYLTDKAGAPVTRDAAVSVGLYKTYAGDDTDLVLEEDLGTISVKDG
ncbi:MAG: hypothetical protein HY897_17620, partial [Deltaproteobacteria bacterium]|nr:hypothetical protein [Deltaproteobacteria bacterium]